MIVRMNPLAALSVPILLLWGGVYSTDPARHSEAVQTIVYQPYQPEYCAACTVCTFSEGNDGHIVYALSGEGFNATHAHQCLNWAPSEGACSIHEGCADSGGGGVAIAQPTREELDAVFGDPAANAAALMARYPDAVVLNTDRSSLQFVGCSKGSLVGNLSLLPDQLDAVRNRVEALSAE